MSFERMHYSGEFEIICDGCGSNDIFSSYFDESLADAKDDGWIFAKDDGDWVHFCDMECKREYFK